MMQAFETLAVATRGPGLYPFTDEVRRFLRELSIRDGLVTCFIRHTSASLLVQENADPDVLFDLENFLRRLVSRDEKL